MNMKPDDFQGLESDTGRETQRTGQRIGVGLGKAARSAGDKFDSAVDYLQDTAENVKQSARDIKDEGWEGIKRRAIEYTTKEPVNALLLALGAGILVGWATRRPKSKTEIAQN